MKALVIDRAAASLLVQVRQLQSADYDAGDQIGNALSQGLDSDLVLGAGLSLVRRDNVARIRTSLVDTAHQLVVGLDGCSIFVGRSSAQALSVLQKLLRFALKIWNQQAFSPAEHTIGGEPFMKYVLFPLSLATASGYRITLQRVRRSTVPAGDHLFAFRHGYDDGGGPNESPPLGVFHSAIHVLTEELDTNLFESGRGILSGTPLSATQFGERERSASGIQVPFDDWLPLLTDRQRGFATRSLTSCERLEGPAGTGKTLALMLKTVAMLRSARERGEHFHALFLTHSIATRRAIEERFDVLDPEDRFRHHDPLSSNQSITVTTLQEWCAGLLGNAVADVEYLDRDAAESKNTQLLYIDEALGEAIDREVTTYERLMSPELLAIVRSDDRWGLAEMVQHEIAVVIKGRAEEDLDRYKQLPMLRYGLPTAAPGDKSWLYLVFKGYQRRLSETNQFDTDDIVLTSLRQLDTPVWRRRRQREGFDGVFVDEAHLFNLNELSLIHFLARDPVRPTIAFAIDRSQAVGDRGVTTSEIEERLLDGKDGEVTRMSVVFRSSPQIVALAQTITATGATLFTNFDDSLVGADSARPDAKDERSALPTYRLVATDEELARAAVEEAEALAQEVAGGRAAVAVIVFDGRLLARIQQEVRDARKPFEVLSRRGDTETVNRALATNRHILALAEYSGGLEFDAVVLVGVDEGRVPQSSGSNSIEARHFAKYSAHNLLYVAVTRARDVVRVLASAERGLSEILEPAVKAGLLVQRA